jgi:hypothetical protein
MDGALSYMYTVFCIATVTDTDTDRKREKKGDEKESTVTIYSDKGGTEGQKEMSCNKRRGSLEFLSFS